MGVIWLSYGTMLLYNNGQWCIVRRKRNENKIKKTTITVAVILS